MRSTTATFPRECSHCVPQAAGLQQSSCSLLGCVDGVACSAGLVLRSLEGQRKGFSRSVLLLVNPCCCRKSFEAAAAPTQQLWRRRIPRTATRWIKMSNLRHPSCFPRKPRRRRRKRKTRIWYDNDDDVLLHLLLLSRLVLVKSRTEFSGGFFFFGHSKHASFLQLRNRVKT